MNERGIEKLLTQAERSESGRRSLSAAMHQAKHLNESVVLLSLQLYKLLRDDNVTAARWESDSEDERFLHLALRDAQVAVDQARQHVSECYIADLKGAGRV